MQQIKLYSLFKYEYHKFTRVSDNAYTKDLAYRVFTERLSVNPLQYSIRPIKIECLEAK